MSQFGGATRVAVGFGGIAIMATTVYQYVSGEVSDYTSSQLALGATMVLGAIVLPCGRKPVVPVDVTPAIGPPSGVMWFRAGGPNTPISVRLSLIENPQVGRYTGGGTLHRGAATIDLFRDVLCNVPVVFNGNGDTTISHGDLAAGLPLFYVKGNAAGIVRLTLTLAPTTAANTTVHGPALRDVEVRAVNIIAPTINAERLVLVHDSDVNFPTTLSPVTLGYTQTDPTYPCNDLRTALIYGNQITCRDAVNPATAYASGTADANLSLALLMRGGTAGLCNLRVHLSSASGQTDPSWFIAPDVNATTYVEPLAFNPFVFRVGGDTVANPNGAMRVAAVPKLRELHQHNVANDFTLARVPIRRPTNAFWGPGTHVTLTAGAGVQIFSNAGATAAVAALQQGDFGGPEYDLWVKTTNAPVMDPAPLPNAVRNPVRVMTTRRIFCGATTASGLQLQYGDIVVLDTFSFDQELDRRVGNATTALLPTLGVAARNRDTALAIAAGHKFYNEFSGQFVNMQHLAGGLRAAFLASMAAVVGNPAKAVAGEAYVAAFLQAHYLIVLNAAIRNLLQAHILRRLIAGANDNARFPQNAGTPGTHAEVLAVSAMLDAGLPANEVSVATYKLHQSGGQGQRFVACANCHGILLPPGPAPATGIRVITG
jgi:hypothetical protein